ncbi:MAG TPA: hypothetical protein VFW02_08075 [Candidatus Limnocylindrales bacterium]|nr:hypothetical protein [Candidatus Limnocylindrales bacterium]
MGSVGLVLQLLTSMVLIASAILARDAPTAFAILMTLGVAGLVLTVVRYRSRRRGPA